MNFEKKQSFCMYGIFVQGFILYSEDIYCIIGNIIKMRNRYGNAQILNDFNKRFTGRFIFHDF